jgi:hypothetical protein
MGVADSCGMPNTQQDSEEAAEVQTKFGGSRGRGPKLQTWRWSLSNFGETICKSAS